MVKWPLERQENKVHVIFMSGLNLNKAFIKRLKNFHCIPGASSSQRQFTKGYHTNDMTKIFLYRCTCQAAMCIGSVPTSKK